MLTAVAKPAGLVQVHRLAFVLVPSARLELAQLSPLPPQDSVSTNFTTKALGAKEANYTLPFYLRQDLNENHLDLFTTHKKIARKTTRAIFSCPVRVGWAPGRASPNGQDQAAAAAPIALMAEDRRLLWRAALFL